MKSSRFPCNRRVPYTILQLVVRPISLQYAVCLVTGADVAIENWLFELPNFFHLHVDKRAISEEILRLLLEQWLFSINNIDGNKRISPVSHPKMVRVGRVLNRAVAINCNFNTADKIRKSVNDTSLIRMCKMNIDYYRLCVNKGLFPVALTLGLLYYIQNYYINTGASKVPEVCSEKRLPIENRKKLQNLCRQNLDVIHTSFMSDPTAIHEPWRNKFIW